MAKQILSITDFTAGEDNRRVDLGIRSAHLLDLHSMPGVVGVNPKPTLLTYAGSTPLSFEVYDENGGTPALFVYDDSADIYQLSGTTFTSVNTMAGVDGGFKLKRFKTGLYYTNVDNGSTVRLGRLVGDASTPANWSNSYKSWTGDAARFTNNQYCPMEVFANALYIANGHYVAKLESDETTISTTALTVDSEVFIQAMAVYQDYLVLSTVSGTSAQKEYIYFWDGVSDYVAFKFEVPKPGASALAVKDNVLYAFIEEKIYVYTGSTFELYKVLPKVAEGSYVTPAASYPSSAVLYKNQLLFGAGGAGWDPAGVYSLGAHSSEYGQALSYAYDKAGAEDNVSALALFASNASAPSGTLYIGFDGTALIYKVDESMDVYTSGAVLITDVYDLGADMGRLISGFKILPIGYSGNVQGGDNEWTIYYRVDRDCNKPGDSSTDFTLLGSITDNNAEKILYGIYKRCRKIQFRIEFVTGGDREDSRMYGFEIY